MAVHHHLKHHILVNLNLFLTLHLNQQVSATSRSNMECAETSFEEKVIKPFITKLIEEIEVAFDIPEHLMGFTAMDPTVMPAQEEVLANYGK